MNSKYFHFILVVLFILEDLLQWVSEQWVFLLILVYVLSHFTRKRGKIGSFATPVFLRIRSRKYTIAVRDHVIRWNTVVYYALYRVRNCRPGLSWSIFILVNRNSWVNENRKIIVWLFDMLVIILQLLRFTDIFADDSCA